MTGSTSADGNDPPAPACLLAESAAATNAATDATSRTGPRPPRSGNRPEPRKPPDTGTPPTPADPRPSTRERTPQAPANEIMIKPQGSSVSREQTVKHLLRPHIDIGSVGSSTQLSACRDRALVGAGNAFHSTSSASRRAVASSCAARAELAKNTVANHSSAAFTRSRATGSRSSLTPNEGRKLILVSGITAPACSSRRRNSSRIVKSSKTGRRRICWNTTSTLPCRGIYGQRPGPLRRARILEQ